MDISERTSQEPRNLQRMDDAGDVAQDGQTDVDEKICATAAFKEDAQWRQDDGEDDFADVAVYGLGGVC